MTTTVAWAVVGSKNICANNAVIKKRLLSNLIGKSSGLETIVWIPRSGTGCTQRLTVNGVQRKNISGGEIALYHEYDGGKRNNVTSGLGQALGSFKIICTQTRIESVSLLLASFAGMTGILGTPGTVDEKGKSLEKQKIAVS